MPDTAVRADRTHNLLPVARKKPPRIWAA